MSEPDINELMAKLGHRIDGNAKTIQSLCGTIADLADKHERALELVEAMTSIREESLHELQVLRNDVDTEIALSRENQELLRQIKEHLDL